MIRDLIIRFYRHLNGTFIRFRVLHIFDHKYIFDMFPCNFLISFLILIALTSHDAARALCFFFFYKNISSIRFALGQPDIRWWWLTSPPPPPPSLTVISTIMMSYMGFSQRRQFFSFSLSLFIFFYSFIFIFFFSHMVSYLEKDLFSNKKETPKIFLNTSICQSSRNFSHFVQ